MGKRVNWAARTVLGPNPELNFGEISIPRKFARDLAHPVPVTSNNIGKVIEWNNDGMLIYFIKKGDIIRRKRRNFKNFKPSVGDVVARELRDGDVIVFNRQPTLSKASLMGYTVKLWGNLTFGMHASGTSPHNADFDGDEGNVHAPQTSGAIDDASTVMHIKENIISDQTNAPIIGMIMDGILAWNLMTKYDKMLDDYDFYYITNEFVGKFAEELTETLWGHNVSPMNTRALISYIIPNDFFFEKTDGDNTVKIRDGVLLEGYLTKKMLNGNGSIIHVLHSDYGSKVAGDFITKAYRMAYLYMDVHPMTIGYRDCILKEGAVDKIRDIAQEAISDVERLNKENVSKESEFVLEDSSQARLNTVMSKVSKVVKEGAESYNSFKVITESGSKGSSFNITQITALVGQQTISGARPPRDVKVNRTLAKFNNNDNSPISRGFVVHSFSEGLEPHEMFYHQMAGRDGLIDTAKKTGVVGDLNRRMIKSLEDIVTRDDGSIGGEAGIYNLSYGDDGFDPAKVENVVIGGVEKVFPINLLRTIAALNYKSQLKK